MIVVCRIRYTCRRVPVKVFPPKPKFLPRNLTPAFTGALLYLLNKTPIPIPNRKDFSKIMKVGCESRKPILRVDFIAEKLMFRIYYPCISNSPGTDPRSYTFNRRFSCKKRDVCQVPSALMTCMLKSLFTDLSFRLLTQIVIRSKFWIFQSPPFSDKSLAYAHALFRLSACNLGHSVSLLFFRKYICLP